MTPCRQHGIAAVELSFLLIPLLLMVFAITEFGRALYEYQILTKSARAAVRILSTRQTSDPLYPGVSDQAKCLAVYGNLDCTGTPLLPQLKTAMVRICDPVACPGSHKDQPIGAQAVNFVTVQVSAVDQPYAFSTVVPFGLPPSITFKPVAVTMRQLR